MSFRPLVDQLAMEVKTDAAAGARRVFQKSVTTGCRVGSHRSLCSGTGKRSVPMFSPKVKSARCLLQVIDRRADSFVDFDLLHARVALDVKNVVALEQIVVEFLGAADVKDRVRLEIKLPDFRQAEVRRWDSREGSARRKLQRRSKPNSFASWARTFAA